MLSTHVSEMAKVIAFRDNDMQTLRALFLQAASSRTLIPHTKSSTK